MSEELREKAKAATPGPWIASGVTHKFGDDRFMFVNVEPLGEIARLPLPDRPAKGYAPTICDQRFIAAANPSAILALLDERDSLLAANEGMRKALTRLVESELAAKVRSLVAGWNGEGVPEEYRFGRHPDSLGVTLPTDCGSMYMLDEVLADLRAALSPALNSKLAPAGEGEANG